MGRPALLAALWISAAHAAPLRLDPSHPPARVGERGGLPVLRYAPGAEWPTHPAVLISLAEGATPPAGATPLGGPFWKLSAADPVATALALLRQPGVVDAFPDVAPPTERRDFDDPSYGGQWYLDEVQATALFAIGLGDAATRVAVIDSGIDIEHIDLKDAVYAPYDALDDDDDPSPNPGEYCDAGVGICDTHGTSVSGIVAARANNGAGIVGLCAECTLVPIKMLGEPDGGLSVTLAAFEHAIAQDVAVINNSWGYVNPTPVPFLLAQAIERAATVPRDGLGALVVFAAGNDDRALGDDEVEALPDVLCVTATDRYGNYTNYTNSGAAVDVSAPSATVTIEPGDEVTTSFGGTSAAAPVVSGIAGWLASVAPELSAAELHALLVDTAVPSPLVTYDENGHHDIYGYGEVSGQALVDALYGVDTGDTAGPRDTAEEKRGGCACAAAPPGRAAASGALALALAAAFGFRTRSRRGS